MSAGVAYEAKLIGADRTRLNRTKGLLRKAEQLSILCGIGVYLRISDGAGQDAESNFPGTDLSCGSETLTVRSETPQTPWLGQSPEDHGIGLHGFTENLECWANMNLDPGETRHLYCSMPELDIQAANQNEFAASAPDSQLSRPPSLETYFWGKYGPGRKQNA